MKIGEAHRTRSSSLYSANTIGAPMHPAPIGVAVRTGKKICETKFEYYWRTVSGQHCLLAEGAIGAPIFTSTNSSVRLAYFHTNRLLFGLYSYSFKQHSFVCTCIQAYKHLTLSTYRPTNLVKILENFDTYYFQQHAQIGV